jgi:hypothetical protein
MPLSYVLGNTLVDPEEITARTRENDKKLVAFGEALKGVTATKNIRGHMPDISVNFSAGTVTMVEFLRNFSANGETPFQPVGIGKPATILLRHVYTGRFGKKDMLLTSAVRDPFTTFNMAPRAINLMPKRVPRKYHIKGPAATENGTELVYYINALTAQSLTLTFDLAFDDFPDELVDLIAGAIISTGSIRNTAKVTLCL